MKDQEQLINDETTGLRIIDADAVDPDTPLTLDEDVPGPGEPYAEAVPADEEGYDLAEEADADFDLREEADPAPSGSTGEAAPEERQEDAGAPGNDNPPSSEDKANERFRIADRSGNRQILIYFIAWLVTLLYWEVILRLDINGSINRTNITLLAFLPAEALFFVSLSGFHKKHTFINGIVSVLLSFGMGFFYFAQLVYFRMTGSLISVSLMGMGGEAVGNFGWTVRDAFVRSIPHMILMALPVIAMGVLSFVRFPFERKEKPAPLPGGGYAVWIHALCFLAAFGLWSIGSFSLSLLGRDRESAWYVFRSDLSDTDTSATRVGTLATTLAEASVYYFGPGETPDENSISTVDLAALDLPKKPSTVQEDVVSVNSVSEDEIAKKTVPVHPWQDNTIDFDKLKTQTEDKTLQSLCDYFGSRAATKTNDYTGLFEGYNVIYICCEAFSNLGIDPDITPTLYKMSTNGIVLNNFYNSFPNTTTNGEFAFATSLWPDVSRFAQSGTAVGSFPQSANVFMPYGLGDLLTANGIPSYAYHNYLGDYYKRCYSWPNLGYSDENTRFMGRGMSFTSNWPASDLEMMEQSVDDYIDQKPFHAYYMTFSGHGPYNASNRMFQKNIETVRKLADGKYKLDECLGYFCGEYELELAMEYLEERLKKAGQLDNTVFVLIGDHFPYYLSDPAAKELNGGEDLDPLERYHSTCIIYNSGLKEPIECDSYCCNVDILPTLLNLLNVEFDSRLLMGTDVFSDGVHRARLYNGSFITDFVRYDKATGKKEWSDAASGYSEEELDSYYKAMTDYVDSEYSAALNMMRSNFYFFVWKNSGLMTPEEADAELVREQNGRALYASEEEAARAKAEAEAAAAAAAEAAAAAAEQEQQQQQQQQEQPWTPPPEEDDPNWQPDPSWEEN
ncbi:MAG: sulfatase-like hydrolase/transferase [Lachnospiraceae bacterium]|nr:sulfatase-like hydrolase/transferase [Lachnospiraceae bacterium]